MKLFTLTDSDGKPYATPQRGTLGGHRRSEVYGRFDCATAARYLARGTYQKSRVFFADEETALAAGYRPCTRCLPGRAAALKHFPAGLIQT